LDANSPAYIDRYGGGQGLNFMMGNNIGIYADGQYTVSVDANDIIANEGDYAVRARHNAVVNAPGNYWGGCPVDPNDFYATEGALILYNPPWCSPFTDFGASMSSGLVNASSSTQENEPAAEDSLFDERLLAALQLLLEGKYEEAMVINVEVLREDNPIKKKYALAQLAECYRLAERNDFIDFIDREVRRNLPENSELYATTLELENLFLVRGGNYQRAIANFLTLKTHFAGNDLTVKHALFSLGYIHYVLLNDAAKGKEYFDELKAKYPDDELSWHAMLLTGEIDLANGRAAHKNEEMMQTSIPLEFSLAPNFPNPFNPATAIHYALPQAGKVTLRIFNVLGEQVRVLVDEHKPAGQYTEVWEGKNSQGKTVASGIYLYQISYLSSELFAQTIVRSGKMSLLR
jgi:tetratricopeptide (TPR) repeat protein